MGRVYRAMDTNLKRQVALKVLPAGLEASAERLARFQTRMWSRHGTLRTAPPQVLFEGGFTHDDSDFALRFMDVAADGRLLLAEPGQTAQPSIVVSPHWDQELKRLLGNK